MEVWFGVLGYLKISPITPVVQERLILFPHMKRTKPMEVGYLVQISPVKHFFFPCKARLSPVPPAVPGNDGGETPKIKMILQVLSV